MTEIISNQTPPKGRRWLKWLASIVSIVVVLLVVAYFVVTSSGFLKAVVLPRVNAALNAQLAVADLGLSPFSQLVLRDVKLTPKDAAPLLNAGLVRVRYNLLAILAGKIVIEEVTIESPTVTIVEHADGTSNLDPLLKKNAAEAKTAGAKAPSAKSAQPPIVDIKFVALKNATIRRVKEIKGGGSESVEVSNLNVTATNIKNAGSGKLDVSAAVAIENVATGSVDSLQATLAGNFSFDLTADLKPGAVNGKAAFAVQKANGKFANATSLNASFDCALTPSEVKELALRFMKADATLAELRVSGPFDAAKTEGRLKVELTSLDRKLLNIAGAVAGIDFGTTAINSTNVLELTKGGSAITASGQLDAARVRITRQSQTTPTVDLHCDYNISINRNDQSALLKSLTVTGTQNQGPLLRAELTSPMTFAWSETSSAGDAALNVAVTDLNLADWRAFAADLAPEGKANLKLKLLSQQGGKQLTFDLDSQVDGLSAKFGSNAIHRADVRLSARGQSVDFKKYSLSEFRAELGPKDQPVLTVSGSGSCEPAAQESDLNIAMQTTLSRLLAMFPQPNVHATDGTLDVKAHVTGKQQTQSVTGQLALTDFTGGYGNYRFANYGSAMDFDVTMKGKQIEIRKAAGRLSEGQNAGGSFEASGNFDAAQNAGQISVKLAGFNERGLRPFLESALGDKKLVSVLLDSTAAASFSAKGDSAVKADLRLANLVVNDPAGKIPATPLEARVQVDTSVSKQVAQIRQCQFTLTPTEHAKNELNLTGAVDFSKSNAITGNLKLAADSLDVTRYYDLFAGKSAAENTPPLAPTVTTSPPAASDEEPDAVKLPFRDFTAEVNIKRFFLREVDIANLQTVAKIDGGHILLKPCQLTLNGAPVSATVDANLGVPGFKYDLAFNGQAVPMAPLVNSFQPERKGQIGGTATATAQVKGAGVTGASLQKNLVGQFDVLATNLNLSIRNLHAPILKQLINLIIGIPDIISNPVGGVGRFLGGALGKLTGAQTQQSGWVDQITQAPIDVISAKGSAGNGVVTLSQAKVQSAAFQAETSGSLQIAPVLTNSTLELPVMVSLSRPLAEKVGLAGNTPTNAVYAKLPDFAKMKGTVGDPKLDVNYLVLAGVAAKATGGVAGRIGGSATKGVTGILGGVGNLITGGKDTSNSDQQTNNTSTQPKRPGNILDLFGLPKK